MDDMTELIFEMHDVGYSIEEIAEELGLDSEFILDTLGLNDDLK